MIKTELERERDYKSIFPNIHNPELTVALRLGNALNKLYQIQDLPTASPELKAGINRAAFSLYCDLRDMGAADLGQYVVIDSKPHTLSPYDNSEVVIFERPTRQKQEATSALEEAVTTAGTRWKKIHEEDEKAARGCSCIRCRQRFEETLRLEKYRDFK